MRPSRIIALGDIGALGFAETVIVRPSALSLSYAVATVLVMWIIGAYRPRIFYRLWNQLPALLGQLTVSTLLFSVWPDRHRVELLEHLPVLVGIVILARLITYGVVRKMRSRPGRSEDALVIGADRSGRLVADALVRSASGIRPVGFIDRPGVAAPAGLPVFGDLAHLDAVVDRMGVRHLIVADAGGRSAALSACLYDCRARNLEVWVIPPMFELGAEFFGSATHDIWAVPFRHLRTPGQHTAARMVKRAFDFTVAATMLLLASPVMVATALAVRLTSAGPVFFRQTRIGQHGREIVLLKFRTMAINSDSDTRWSVAGSLGVTPIGAFLRRSCIDELPQLINVVRGDMSLVGPRPERPYFAKQFSATVPRYTDRLRVPVGITGWAQIHGLRGDTSIDERTRFDNFYIEHWSLGFDLVIMARTISSIVHWLIDGDDATANDPEAPREAPGLASVAIPVTSGGKGPSAVA